MNNALRLTLSLLSFAYFLGELIKTTRLDYGLSFLDWIPLIVTTLITFWCLYDYQKEKINKK